LERQGPRRRRPVRRHPRHPRFQRRGPRRPAGLVRHAEHPRRDLRHPAGVADALMGYRLGAVLTVAVHLAFVGFVLVGGFAAWRWRAVLPWHIAAVAISGALAVTGLDCPLTAVEKWFRRHAGVSVYKGGFIAHYLVPGGMTPGRRLALRVATVAV